MWEQKHSLALGNPRVSQSPSISWYSPENDFVPYFQTGKGICLPLLVSILSPFERKNSLALKGKDYVNVVDYGAHT